MTSELMHQELCKTVSSNEELGSLSKKVHQELDDALSDPVKLNTILQLMMVEESLDDI